MQELAVYGRTGPFGTNERAFYIPHLRTKLPDGNSLLQRDEAEGKAYDDTRQTERERMAEEDERTVSNNGVGGDGLPDTKSLEEDLRRNKSGADRRMLQTIFDSSPDFDVGIEEIVEVDDEGEGSNDDDDDGVVGSIERPVEDMVVSTKQEVEDDKIRGPPPTTTDSKIAKEDTIVDTTFVNDTPIDTNTDDKTNDNNTSDDATTTPSEQQSNEAARIITSIAKPIATGDWSKLPRRNPNRPDPKDNPIFQRFRKYGVVALPNPPGTLATDDNNTGRPREERAPSATRPPFPSDEYFVGIWRLQSTPGGPSVDERRLMGEALVGVEASTSENLVLRADGLTAGGPILDEENRQRAAGGTWRFFQAEWVGGDEDGDGDGDGGLRLTTRLSIRLVIPPKKDKILVMEGEVKRGGVSSPLSLSEANLRDMRSLTPSIGMIPDATEPPTANDPRTKGNTPNDEDSFLQCSGEVWVEDAVPGKNGDRNRTRLGKFSLLKMKDRNPNEYVYTIPAPEKYQD